MLLPQHSVVMQCNNGVLCSITHYTTYTPTLVIGSEKKALQGCGMPSRHDLRHWAGFPHSPGDCPDQPWICTTTIMPPVSPTLHCTSNSCEHRHATMLLWNPLSIWHRSLWHKIVPKSSKKDIYNRHSVLRNIFIFFVNRKDIWIFANFVSVCRTTPRVCWGGPIRELLWLPGRPGSSLGHSMVSDNIH